MKVPQILFPIISAELANTLLKLCLEAIQTDCSWLTMNTHRQMWTPTYAYRDVDRNAYIQMHTWTSEYVTQETNQEKTMQPFLFQIWYKQLLTFQSLNLTFQQIRHVAVVCIVNT